MKTIKTNRLLLFISALSLTVISCTLIDVARDALGRLPTTTPTATPVSGTDHWYIATDGVDDGPCSEAEPCQTLRHVSQRVTDNDVIHIGPGTFIEPGLSDSYIVSWGVANLRLTIEGAGAGSTILDSEGRRIGFRLSGTGSATLRDLTIRNSGDTGSGGYGICIEIRDQISVVLENVVVEDCEFAGISQLGSTGVFLRNTTVRRVVESANERAGDNAVLVKSQAPLTIEGGEFTDSARTGILTSNRLNMTGSLVARTGTTAINIAEGTLDGVEIRETGPSPWGSALNTPSAVRIDRGGPVELRNVTIQDYGRCVWVREQTNPTILDSTLSGCGTTGLVVDGNASVTVESSTISSNGHLWPGSAHALGVLNFGTVTLSETIIRNNHGEGIKNYGNLTMFDTWVDDNSGGIGLTNWGTATIGGSLFTGTDFPGEAILSSGRMTLTNSTISNNERYGITAVGGNLTLRHVTIVDNGAQGISARDASSSIEIIENSLLANNGTNDCAFYGDFSVPTLVGVNLDTDGSCSFGTSVRGLRFTMDDLADNGGPTMTHALHSDSRAVDAISSACTSVDQRGASRPAGSGCDVGAFELNQLFLRDSISGEGTPTAPVTVTPSTATSLPRVVEDSLCWQGPGPQYEVVSALQADTIVEVLGRGVEGDWWVIDNPRYQGVRCWAPGDAIEVDPGFDYPNTLFEIPPLPTATPFPGCLFYDGQQNEVCYPIDQCPVDFEDSLGACVP